MSKNLKRAALTVIGAVTAAGLLLPATAQAAPVPAGVPAGVPAPPAGQVGAMAGWKLDIFVDAWGNIGPIIGNVLNDIRMENDRPGFVHRQLDDTMNAYPGYNVMIINDKLNYSLDLQGVVA
ncbi:hypothetical protein, partial [Streptomyces sp. NPDC048659]|uniref:hypothetical protein n=1 Tax=Streptomyces sp. NPDC048659 TaxID=3155489 RepID=UPI003420768C